MSISCEASSNFDILTTSERKGFAASPIETAKPGTFSDTFVNEGFPASPMDTARLSTKFHRISQNATPATQFCTLSPLGAAVPMQFAKNTQHDTSEVLLLPRKMVLDTSKVLLRLPRKMQRMF